MSAARERRKALMDWIRVFSPGAVLSFVVLVTTGVLQSKLQVGSIQGLFETPYGWVLTGKLALVALLVAVASWHVLKLRPHVAESLECDQASESDRGPIRRWLGLMRAEPIFGLAIAVLVGGLNTLTPAFQDAPEQVGIPELRPQPVVVAESLGDPKAIITLFPGRLGPNGIDIKLMTVRDTAAEAVQRVKVWITAEAQADSAEAASAGTETTAAQWAEAERRGPGHFVGNLSFPAAGRWRLHLRAERPGEAPAKGSLLLTIPVPDTRLIVERAEREMNRLDSAVMEETLTSDGVNVISTRYEFVAPDRMHYRIKGGAEVIAMNDVRFTRRPSEEWEKSAWLGLSPFRWPRYQWAEYPKEITLLGQDQVRGHQTWVVAFLDPAFDAHYRLWVGVEDGRVHRLRMTATGHFMTWEFVEFNNPLDVEAPIGEASH